MKENWENLLNNLIKFNDCLQNFVDNADLKPSAAKNLKELQKNWGQIVITANNFDSFIAPVDAINIAFPCDSKEFSDAWQFWKDYLCEQHGVIMRSRNELISLANLWDMAEKNKTNAIKIINFSITVRAKNLLPLTSANKNDVEPKTLEHDPHFKNR